MPEIGSATERLETSLTRVTNYRKEGYDKQRDSIDLDSEKDGIFRNECWSFLSVGWYALRHEGRVSRQFHLPSFESYDFRRAAG
jgi:hypothetical protein